MNISSTLQHIANGLKRKSAAGAVLYGAIAFAAVFRISGWADWPRREVPLLIAGAGFILLCIIATFIAAVRGMLKYRSIKKMALHVEECRPHYMDSFAAAVELESLSRELRPMEKALLEDVYSTLQSEKRGLDSLFPGYGWIPFLWRLLAAAVFIQLGCLSPRWKAFSGVCSAMLKNESGIVITAPVPDVPLHSDYTVKIRIARGEQVGDIFWRTDEDSGSSRLEPDGAGNFKFTFYDVSGDFDYRVFTPDLSSKWMKVKAYTPPSFMEMRVSAVPPAYSGLEVKTLDGPGVIDLLEGGKLAVSLKLDSAVSGTLVTPAGSNIPFTEKDEWRTAEANPGTEGVFTVRLADREGHKSDFPVTVNAVKDAPPEITIVEPADESFLKMGEALRLSVNAADDLGLTSLELVYSVSGGDRKSMLLKKADGSREWNVSTLWELRELDLKPGSILNCQVVARDNRPEPNVTRSTLFFVTIRPNREDVQEEAQGNESEKEANVSDLVAESKRLLRLTWDMNGMENSSGIDKLREGLETLEKEIASRKEQLQAMAGGMLGPLAEYFDNAVQSVHSGVSIVGRNLVEESIPFQEKGLASLVLIETELLKNAIKSKKSSESGEGGEEDGQNQQEQKEDADGTQDLGIMQQAIDELKRISLLQGDVVHAMRRNDASTLQLSGRQGRLKDDTDAVRRSLAPVREALPAVDLLNAAGGEMAGAERSLRGKKLEHAARYGDRALLGVSRALAFLENAIKKSAADEMKKMAEQAAEMAKRQREAENMSRSQTGNAAGLRDMQEKIKQETEALMNRLKKAGTGMQEYAPETGREVNKAVSRASGQGLENAQDRARRALAYRRMRRAAEEQQKAAEILEEMAGALKQAAENMNSVSELELRQALGELAGLAAETASASEDGDSTRGKQRIQQARRRAAEITEQLAQNTGSEGLMQIAKDLNDPAKGDGQETRRQISAAARSIIKMLDEIAAHNRRFIRRSTAAPPEKYRRDVERYFREISK